uniref:Putative ovule protein n=1 Tax=Solanum chacoense TaxID=4108 RepID=A0A0V0H0C7_SOLCH
MTTKTKNPSKIGPTGYWLPFFAVVSGTAPRLVIFFSNLSTFLSARRLDVVIFEGKCGGRRYMRTEKLQRELYFS